MSQHLDDSVIAYTLYLFTVLLWQTHVSIVHWRGLGASFGGGQGRRISAENFFTVPPKC